MERLSRLTVIERERNTLAPGSGRLGIRFNKLIGWFREKRRQFSALPRDPDLIRAVLSEERSPVEGGRYRNGEILTAYRADGSRRRLRICGVRSGGFSNVYAVIDLEEMKPYCLKESRAVPGDEVRKNEKLAVEACIGLRLGHHPHLVTTHEAFFLRSRLFILTEYLSATSLDVQLKSGPLDLASALKYAIHICRAMEHARTTLPQFVHGDIKPGNCLIAPQQILKLGDFGQASAVGIGKHLPVDQDSYSEESDLHSSIGWGGTAAYMAPEMFDFESPSRDAADIYAFGVTLFEMLSGSRPFAAPSKHELAEMHRTAELPLSLPAATGVPSSVADLVRRCLAKEPSARPKDFSSVEEELQRAFLDRFGDAVVHEPETALTEPEIARRAVSYASLGRVDDAVDCIDAALDHSANRSGLLAAKANCLAEGLRLDEAYAASTAALMTHAGSFAVFFANARILAAHGKMDRAEEYLCRALDAEPDNCIALNLLGELASKSGRIDEGIGYLERSAMLDPAQPEAWTGLARAHLQADRVENAFQLAQKAVRIDPNRTDSQILLGDVCGLIKDFPEAVRSYKSALRSSYRKEAAKSFVRACCSAYSAEGREIDLHLVKVLTCGSGFFRHRGTAVAKRRFLKMYVDLIRRDHDPLLLFFLDDTFGSVAAHLPETLGWELSTSLNTILSNSAEQKVPKYSLASLGKVFYHLGNYQECRTAFRLMLRQYGPSEIAYYYLAACCEIEGDFRDSLAFYRKALRLEDSEDTRTGICRVSASLREHSGKTPQVSADQQSPSAELQ